MIKVQTLNNISLIGLEKTTKRELRKSPTEMTNPDAILVRSAKMHDMDIGDNLKSSRPCWRRC